MPPVYRSPPPSPHVPLTHYILFFLSFFSSYISFFLSSRLGSSTSQFLSSAASNRSRATTRWAPIRSEPARTLSHIGQHGIQIPTYGYHAARAQQARTCRHTAPPRPAAAAAAAAAANPDPNHTPPLAHLSLHALLHSADRSFARTHVSFCLRFHLDDLLSVSHGISLPLSLTFATASLSHTHTRTHARTHTCSAPHYASPPPALRTSL